MTTEEDFQAMLDANPDDHGTRLIFADWLDEQEPPDLRGPGYRALGLIERYPYFVSTNYTYGNYSVPGVYEDRSDLPDDWWALVVQIKRGATRVIGHDWTAWVRRREADDAAALAFSRLPAHRRAELLSPPVPA